MKRKLATVLLSAGVVAGFGTGLLSLGCGGHRQHDKGRYAADCDRHQQKRGTAAPEAPAAPAPAPAPEGESSGSL